MIKIKYKKFLPCLIFFYFIFNIEGKARNTPSSFADLAETLMPSVVNIQPLKQLKLNQVLPTISAWFTIWRYVQRVWETNREKQHPLAQDLLWEL